MSDRYFGSHEIRADTRPVKTSSDRNFGLVFAAVGALIAGVNLFKHGASWPYWLAASAVFLICALAVPRWLAPLNIVWTRFGLLLHRVMNPVVLGIMFFVFITPMGWLMRLTGKDPLRRKFDPTATSYWIAREPPGPLPPSFSQQF